MPLSKLRASERPDAAWACRRYEEIRVRLPAARFPARALQADNLGDLADEFDVFVLDGYGVLNIGTEPVPGAVARMAALRAAGKRLIVLTNGATVTATETARRYADLGYDFTPADVVSSRDALVRGVASYGNLRWGVAAKPGGGISDIAPRCVRLADGQQDYDDADGFILLSSAGWTRARHQQMLATLRARPRPLLVGNPDLVAPVEDGLALQPGAYAHEIADATGIAPEFFGKPYANAFALVAERIGPGVDPRRIAMVGDTPWTDILGGAAIGWRTVLVRDHGLVKGITEAGIAALSDIRPDFMVRTT